MRRASAPAIPSLAEFVYFPDFFSKLFSRAEKGRKTEGFALSGHALYETHSRTSCINPVLKGHGFSRAIKGA
jgi:hypothetical protein